MPPGPTVAGLTRGTPPQATISYYQMMHMQTAPLPVHFQMLCESSKLYDPGQQYAYHVGQLQRGEEPDVRYDFEPYASMNTWYGLPLAPGAAGQPPAEASVPACPTRSPVMRTRKGSFVGDAAATEATGSPEKDGGPSDGALAKERRGECRAGVRGRRGLPVAPCPTGDAPFRRRARTPGAQVVAHHHVRLGRQPGPQPWLR